ncbi:MAG: ribosome hibernation-promoting factor, HPF/YfiA family [Actinomycetota bacterium]
MELVLKARGTRLTDGVRRAAEHKLAKLARVVPEATRLEVEVVGHPTPRIDGGRRVEVACATPRRTYRAHGSGRDVEEAIDQVVERLERQISRYRGKLHDRWTGRTDRLQSPRTSPQSAGGSS